MLTTRSPADYEAAVALWDKYSGAKGLLNATRNKQPGGRYVWDGEKRQFIQVGAGRKGGRVVTRNDLRLYVRRVSNATRNDMRKETAQLIAGAIILSVWYYRMQSMMKALYSTIWLLSIGGILFDDNAQRNLFYALVLAQFQFLNNFAMQLSTGRKPMGQRAVIRAGMYGEWGNGEHQNIKLEIDILDGKQEGRRVLGDNENHCYDSALPGCIELASIGWLPIRQVTPIGLATCLSNCHCSIETR